MIQIGSKEEVAFLLALVRHPHPAGQAAEAEIAARLKALIPCPAWPNARASCGS